MENYDNLDGNSELKLTIQKNNQRALNVNRMIKDKINDELLGDIASILGTDLENAGISMEDLIEKVNEEESTKLEVRNSKEDSKTQNKDFNEDNSQIWTSDGQELE